jgi:ArsR family transcriptional regulator
MKATPTSTRPRRTTGATRRDPGPGVRDAETARLAKALAHPARVTIVRMLLARGDCVCGQIVLGLPLAQATVSQHLKVLKEAGIVRGEVDGPRVCYCVDPDALARLGTLLAELAGTRGTR